MSYSSHETICLYTDDLLVKSKMEIIAKTNNLKVFYADCEADLIAVPYSVAVVDFNSIKSCYLQLIAQGYLEKGKISSHTKVEGLKRVREYISYVPIRKLNAKFIAQFFTSP